MLLQGTASAQTKFSSDCRILSPVVALRQNPVEISNRVNDISKHFSYLTGTKKHIIQNQRIDALSDGSSYDVGFGPWLSLQYSPENKTLRDDDLFSTTNNCKNLSSPYKATLGLDVMNTEISQVNLTFGVIGGYQFNDITVSSVDSKGNENQTFNKFSIANNGLFYGTYLAIYGDSNYLFASYLQNEMPIELNFNSTETQGNSEKKSIFGSSLGGFAVGYGMVANIGLDLELSSAVGHVSGRTTPTKISYSSSVSKEYKEIEPSWLYQTTNLSLGYSSGGKESFFNIKGYTVVNLVANLGDDVFRTLDESQHNQLLDAIKNIAGVLGATLQDTYVQNKLGVQGSYGSYKGLTAYVDVSVSNTLADGYQFQNSGVNVELIIDYRF